MTNYTYLDRDLLGVKLCEKKIWLLTILQRGCNRGTPKSSKRGNFFGPSNFNFDGTTSSVMSKLGSASIFVTIGALVVLFFSQKTQKSHFSLKSLMIFNNLWVNFPKI